MTANDVRPADAAVEPRTGIELFDRDGLQGVRYVAWFAAQLRFKSADDRLLAIVQQNVWSWKADFRVYDQGDFKRPVLTVMARSVFSGSLYDVTDPKSGQRFGVLRRLKTRFVMQPTWEVESEDGKSKAQLVQQKKVVMLRLQEEVYAVASIAFFSGAFDIEFTPEARDLLPRQLGVAAMVLMMAMHHGLVS